MSREWYFIIGMPATCVLLVFKPCKISKWKLFCISKFKVIQVTFGFEIKGNHIFLLYIFIICIHIIWLGRQGNDCCWSNTVTVVLRVEQWMMITIMLLMKMMRKKRGGEGRTDHSHWPADQTLSLLSWEMIMLMTMVKRKKKREESQQMMVKMMMRKTTKRRKDWWWSLTGWSAQIGCYYLWPGITIMMEIIMSMTMMITMTIMIRMIMMNRMTIMISRIDQT